MTSLTTRLLTVLLSCAALSAALCGQTFSAEELTRGAVDADLMAGGVVWFDYNNDRYPDLLLLNGTASCRLLRNDWDGSFTDVSERSGLLSQRNVMGGASADFNGDGLADLFLTTLDGEPCRLLLNTGAGGFRDASVDYGVTQPSYGASVTTGDLDGDGDADVYVTNYLAGATAREGGQPNFYYRNDGTSFREMAAELGLADTGCGLGATITDLDDDGRPDVYVANDFGYLVEPNAFFSNDYPNFSRQEMVNGTAATINGMGIARGDYDGDGDADLYVTNIRENPLFRNEGNGDFFSFQSFAAGVDVSAQTSWGTALVDFDLDGHLDLVVANGQIAQAPSRPEPQRFFRNTGEGGFTDVSVAAGLDSIYLLGRGLAQADYNLDGYPDLAINAVSASPLGAETARLLTATPGDGNWLAVETPANALTLLAYAGGRTLRRDVDGGSSYLSHAAGPVHFGLGDAALVDSLYVTFTDGTATTYYELPGNQLLGLRTDGSTYRIHHESAFDCGPEAGEPVVSARWAAEDGAEVLRLRRDITKAYGLLETQVVELEFGETFRDQAWTQDAMLVDTVARGEGQCPSLRTVDIRVAPDFEGAGVYPNPLTGGELTVRFPAGGRSFRLELVDASGRTVLDRTQTIGEDQRSAVVPVGQLARGTYLGRLTTVGGLTTSLKLIRL